VININNTLIAGGQYKGSKLWNKEATKLDNCFKLYYIEEGEAWLYNEDKQFRLVAGEMYFINGFHISSQFCPVKFKVCWLHFISDSIFLRQALLKFPVATKLESADLQQYVSAFALLESFFKDFSMQHKAISKTVLAQYFKIQSLLSAVVSVLAENSDLDTFYLSGQGSRLLRAIEFINSNYKTNVTLKQLAGLCFMSENYFHSLFKKEFTVTPNVYILQLRMNEALNLLSNTDLSVKEVASEAGYPDAAYFSRTFSKYFGLSPNKYRSLHSTRIP